MQWDPQQYSRYADERGRPFADLTARIPVTAPARVVDLGCGPGDRTRTLAQRWPDAQVTGIDSSPEMIEQAQRDGGSVRYHVGTARDLSATGIDVLVSNACLQWVPDHAPLITRWSRELPPGGVIALQVRGTLGGQGRRA